MRTKALLFTAMLSAAGLLTASAQAVYSVNVVGYINKEVPAGYSLIANQLDNGQGNLINDVLPDVPFGASIFKFDPAAAAFVNSVNFGSWEPNLSLAPGEGAFLLIDEPATLTFVGEVMQGTGLTVNVPAGYSIASSIVPQSASLTDIGFPAEFGDTVFFFRNGAFESSVAFPDFTPPAVPEVGEAFFILNDGAAKTWSRSFSVE
jgi:hypothetical protein